MTPDDLAAKGRALCGARWQTALAAELGVADRTMRRWLAGDSPVPEAVEARLRAMLKRRHDELGDLSAGGVRAPQAEFRDEATPPESGASTPKHDPVERLRLIQEISAAARAKVLPGPDAAHAADFLYDEDGLPN
ncbi:hypothetical protein [Phenylobacterium aquaticum]|uniref:hypothetical protein n=1 Tax=Phenylobacterium aquaticum TaxID=1763816 RepID=UPI0026F36328|nr:hypothetical protein [Phenylobacterium aquaticum]